MKPGKRQRRRPSVLFAGQSYYHAWYLSRELRKLGWRADVLNWDTAPQTQGFYHGQDYSILAMTRRAVAAGSRATSGSICGRSRATTSSTSPTRTVCASAIRCTAGSPSTSVRTRRSSCCGGWARRSSTPTMGASTACRRPRSRRGATGPCAWTAPGASVRTSAVTSATSSGGVNRNRLADLSVQLPATTARTSTTTPPSTRCRSSSAWTRTSGGRTSTSRERWRLDLPASTVRIYHAVGQLPATHRRAVATSSRAHIYLPLIERMKAEGYDVELTFVHDVPNRDVRFVQVQADIVVDMLTFGWFGSNVREALMLGKPVVCYLRPEWLERMRRGDPRLHRRVADRQCHPGDRRGGAQGSRRAP